jgi:hypothetical protein
MKQQTSRKTGCDTLFGNDLHRVFFSLPSSLVQLLLFLGGSQSNWYGFFYYIYNMALKQKKKKKKKWKQLQYIMVLSLSSLVYISRTGSLFYRVSLYITPRPTANPPLRVWSALREVVSTSPTVAQLATLHSVRWMVPMLIIIPQSLWEVVFTSPTVTKVTLYRVRWMTTNKKHFRRDILVFGNVLLPIAKERTMVQGCHYGRFTFQMLSYFVLNHQLKKNL